ncbi:MAG: protein phosphatase 2C domain-containing protein [Clostridia bacterium]|nr:protein phosphatase 2C domain-containing protein [Clostridia bacterium]
MVIQTYQQGGRHKVTEQPCEDRTYSLSENGVDVIALADGAGNAKYTHSADGAEWVCKAVCTFFCNNFDKFYEEQSEEKLSTVIMAVCQKALQKRADELELDSIARLSSTLLCVAIKKEKVIGVHIGDGVIGKLTPDGTKVVSAPENGEFAGTTYFITNPQANRFIHIFKEYRKEAVSYFLMSDGTADYVYDKLTESFYTAAKKMALMVFDEKGQEKLEKTVKDYMVEKDKKSDDCSFICLSTGVEIKDMRVFQTQDSEKKVQGTDNIILYAPLFEEGAEEEGDALEDEGASQKTDLAHRKKTAILVAAISVALIAVFALSLFLIHKGEQKKKETVSASQSVSATRDSPKEDNRYRDSSVSQSTVDDSKEEPESTSNGQKEGEKSENAATSENAKSTTSTTKGATNGGVESDASDSENPFIKPFLEYVERVGNFFKSIKENNIAELPKSTASQKR